MKKSFKLNFSKIKHRLVHEKTIYGLDYGIFCLNLTHEPKCEAGESVNFIETITIGIVGKGNENEKATRVYTRVTSVLNWIRNNMK